MLGGPGNGTGTDSTIPITDTEVNSLIHTSKVWISASLWIVSQYGHGNNTSTVTGTSVCNDYSSNEFMTIMITKCSHN
jgi:hypothetical protein